MQFTQVCGVLFRSQPEPQPRGKGAVDQVLVLLPGVRYTIFTESWYCSKLGPAYVREYERFRSVLGSWVDVRTFSTFPYFYPRPAWFYPRS